MALRIHTVQFPPAQLAALRRINAVLDRAPRLRTDPWRVEAGQRLSTWLDAAAGRLTPLSLKRRGVTVEVVSTDDEHPVPLRILRPAGPPRAVVLDIHGVGSHKAVSSNAVADVRNGSRPDCAEGWKADDWLAAMPTSGRASGGAGATELRIVSVRRRT